LGNSGARSNQNTSKAHPKPSSQTKTGADARPRKPTRNAIGMCASPKHAPRGAVTEWEEGIGLRRRTGTAHTPPRAEGDTGNDDRTNGT